MVEEGVSGRVCRESDDHIQPRQVYIKILVWILNVSWKLKWSSGDALLTKTTSARRRRGIRSGQTMRRGGNGKQELGKGNSGIGEGEVGILFFANLFY
jgi:hypothetical protein